ncbi:hypothetical protein [Albibacterium bauzanense]|uniref:Carboxypeptidase-like protein n=1 Tax=Albibacterium bauzanense TaxID=653929 RepID=A0A4R1M1C3_9SPHI|nr:hypothetical protein [Albibacterium bauzanense]TCK85756.1 hypothetical protein C8N28_1069 [Albibacterium bauzanense]
MKKLFLLVSVLLTSVLLVQAQSYKGVVMELDSSKPIAQVEVSNLSTHESVETNLQGEFSIEVKLNELLSFSYPGFRVDTLLVTDYEYKRIYLTPIPGFNILEDVEITELSDAQLEQQIQVAQQEGETVQFNNNISISPSRLFGSKARAARARYPLLIAERENRAIMAKFTSELITSLTPLQGKDLDQFIVKYKPSYAFITKSDEEQIRLYIMDSYKKYKELSPEERDAISLEATTADE